MPVNVKVILQTDVAGLGEEGEVKEVAGGYARNYLLPRKLAVPATKGNLKIREQQHEQIVHKQEQRRAEARELAERLAGQALRFAVRVGAQGRLYGSVRAQARAAARPRRRRGVCTTPRPPGRLTTRSRCPNLGASCLRAVGGVSTTPVKITTPL